MFLKLSKLGSRNLTKIKFQVPLSQLVPGNKASFPYGRIKNGKLTMLLREDSDRRTCKCNDWVWGEEGGGGGVESGKHDDGNFHMLQKRKKKATGK